MTAVSPRNPNLCLSCEQLVEDDSAELERLLFAAEHPEFVNRIESDPFAAGLLPATLEPQPPSAEQMEEHHVFVAPA